MINCIELDQRKIGPDNPCFIIAEAGVNHNGDLNMARQLIDVAIEAKADAVKFQTFKADHVMTPFAPKASYQKDATGPEESQLDMVRKLELSKEAHEELASYAMERGILFMSTPFDEPSVDLLDGLGIPIFKIPSGEITNLPFLEYVSNKKKPIIMSTGMSTLGEVETAVEIVSDTGNNQLVLLHCVSNYPAAPADVNLLAMLTMRQAFGCPVGFSDHTLGIEIPIAATALGACVIEKHFTLDRSLPGPDHQASLEPDQLAEMIRAIRNVEVSLGDGKKHPAHREIEIAKIARRSLVAAQDINSGTMIEKDMISIKRPGTGLHPPMLNQLIGRRTRIDISAGEILTLSMFS